MPEEGLETQDIKEQLDGAQERAEGGEKGEKSDGARWLTWLSLSTACIAALAAIASLHAGSLANEAIVMKSDAVLAESEFADNWAEYQARNIKGYLFETQAALVPDAQKAEAQAHAKHEREGALGVRAASAALRLRVDASNEGSAKLMERHEMFARTVTIFQISIAIAAIAALSRRRALWWLSLFGGGAGTALLLSGLLAAPHADAPQGEAAPATSWRLSPSSCALRGRQA